MHQINRRARTPEQTAADVLRCAMGPLPHPPLQRPDASVAALPLAPAAERLYRWTDLVRNWQRLGACALAFLGACAATPRYAPGKHYFLWANLYIDPPVPSDE